MPLAVSATLLLLAEKLLTGCELGVILHKPARAFAKCPVLAEETGHCT